MMGLFGRFQAAWAAPANASTSVGAEAGRVRSRSSGTLTAAQATMQVWVDCDSGIDDAQALLALAAAQRQGSIRVQGVSCVAGNVPQSQGLVNLQRVVCALRQLEWPVFRGAERPMDGKDRTYTDYYGKDGLGDIGETWPTKDDAQAVVPVQEGTTAAESLVKAANDYGKELHIVALGPLTNIALALDIDPQLPQKVASLHCMGGTIRGEGNCTAAAEYNWVFDPEAADIVVQAGFDRMIIVPWETTATTPIPWEALSEWGREASGPTAVFFQGMLEMFRSQAGPGDPGFYSANALAMCCCLHPPVLAASIDRNVVVERKGEHTRGACVVDHRSWSTAVKNATLVAEIDNDSFLQAMRTAFTMPHT